MFIGNVTQYHDLVRWLLGPNEDTNVCVVAGPTGCGKTYGIKAAIADTKKQIILFDTSNCSNGKDFKDKYMKAVQSNVVAQFSGTSLNDMVIFIDELDALLAIDRTFFSSIKELPSTIKIKIVITGTVAEAKRVPIGHKYISIGPIAEADILAFLKSVYRTEKKRVAAKVIMEAAENCNGNLALALKHIPRMHNVDQFIDVADVYRNTQHAYQVFLTDQWLHPLRFHENLVFELKQRLAPRNKLAKDTIYCSILHDYVHWDMLMTHDMPEHAVYILSMAIRRLDRLPLKKTAAPPQNNFTKMINMLSVKKKGAVTLFADSEGFPWSKLGVHEKSFLPRK